ncbi:MAG: phosphoglucomutase/phosphomannomutase family protein [Saprospiraceae bacterium]|nr:phosphoglucomutase/phosphomannomutase family protein [Saprospiraceae bacterium]
MQAIRFGTDGWRAIIAQDYTVENVRRVSQATLTWARRKGVQRVVIGYDCRFGGELFQNEIARVLAAGGIECLLSHGIASTPMVSLGVVHHRAGLGIVVTASHNPPSYNGFKLKSALGSPLLASDVADIEREILPTADEPAESFESLVTSGRIRMVNLQGGYVDHVRRHFDLDRIRTNVRLAYDAMYGAGQEVMRILFPDMLAFHCTVNPGFGGTPPEPIARNLSEIMVRLAALPGQYTGVATDGDADRVAFIDSSGKMVDSHHLLLLLLHYLVEHRKLRGTVVASFSVSSKLEKLAQHYGLKYVTTRIGFKYIAEVMLQEEVLVGGEESGGLAMAGHIPERDGIWIALTLLQYMATTGKTLQQLIDEVYKIVGPFCYDRIDLPVAADVIDRVRQQLSEGIRSWGNHAVVHADALDGYKYFLEGDRFLLIRPSGTEPVLRIYAQGTDANDVKHLLALAREGLAL